MLNVATAEERRALNLHGTFKGEYYRDCDADLFVESELDQAQTIADISGKPVLSLHGPVMCYPGHLTPRVIIGKAKKKMKALIKSSALKLVPGGRVPVEAPAAEIITCKSGNCP
jgi:hypothetical protein